MRVTTCLFFGSKVALYKTEHWKLKLNGPQKILFTQRKFPFTTVSKFLVVLCGKFPERQTGINL